MRTPLERPTEENYFFGKGGPCLCPELTATGKSQSGRPKQFFEDGLMTTYVSEYKTSAERGGQRTALKMWECNGQKTQATPAETNAIRNLLPQLMSMRP